MSVGSSSIPFIKTNEEAVQSSEKILVQNRTFFNNGTYIWTVELNYNTITTGFYVLAAVGSIIIIYFVFKAISLRRRNYKVRRYGVIASREDVEMTPLENEDDDEDSTVFDISIKNHARS